MRSRKQRFMRLISFIVVGFVGYGVTAQQVESSESDSDSYKQEISHALTTARQMFVGRWENGQAMDVNLSVPFDIMPLDESSKSYWVYNMQEPRASIESSTDRSYGPWIFQDGGSGSIVNTASGESTPFLWRVLSSIPFGTESGGEEHDQAIEDHMYLELQFSGRAPFPFAFRFVDRSVLVLVATSLSQSTRIEVNGHRQSIPIDASVIVLFAEE